MSTAKGIAVHVGHARDPRKDPRFGDVFRWWNDPDQYAVYLTSDESHWIGLNVEHDTIISGYVPIDVGWVFVETIAAHATGGLMPPPGLSPRPSDFAAITGRMAAAIRDRLSGEPA